MELSELYRVNETVQCGYDALGQRLVFIKKYPSGSEAAERMLEVSRVGLSCIPSLIHWENDGATATFYQQGFEEPTLDKRSCRNKKSLVRDLVMVADALSEFHKALAEPVMDMTPDNVLIHGNRAVFVDLATTQDQCTSGYEAPELLVSINAHTRATDVYQFGVMILDLMGRSGIKCKRLKAIAERCKALAPKDRPLIADVAEELRELEFEGKPKRPLWVPLVAVFLLGIISGGTLNRTKTVPSAASIVKHLSVSDVASVREVQGYAAQLELEARMELCKALSERLPARDLNESNLQAWFYTENPAIVAGGDILGLGSRVRLGDGSEGYVYSVRLERVEIMTPDGAKVFRSKIHEKQVGLANTVSMSDDPPVTIAVWPGGDNRWIIDRMAEAEGLKPPALDLPILGLWTHATVKAWIESIGENPELAIPVRSAWVDTGEALLFEQFGPNTRVETLPRRGGFAREHHGRMMLRLLGAELKLDGGKIVVSPLLEDLK